MRYLSLLVFLMPLCLAACVSTDDVRRTRIFDEQTLLALRPGLTPEQVLERMGTPTRVTTDGRIVWYYGTAFPPRSPMFVDEAESRRRLGVVYFSRRFTVERPAVLVARGEAIVDVATGARADDGAARMWRILYDEP